MLIHVPSPQSGASGICTKPSTNATRFLSLCSSSRRANSCEVPWGDGNGSPGCGPWDRTSEFSGDLICDLGILGDQQYVWFNKFYVCPIGSTWFAPFLLDENQWKNHWLSSTKISNIDSSNPCAATPAVFMDSSRANRSSKQAPSNKARRPGSRAVSKSLRLAAKVVKFCSKRSKRSKSMLGKLAVPSRSAWSLWIKGRCGESERKDGNSEVMKQHPSDPSIHDTLWYPHIMHVFGTLCNIIRTCHDLSKHGMYHGASPAEGDILGATRQPHRDHQARLDPWSH